jgi:CelD/BcsL family acetyltransferase involved in cellulose biosynthesis
LACGNADWMMVLPDLAPRLSRAALQNLLARFGRQHGGIDLIALGNQPASWSGVGNPLLQLPHQPGPNNLYLGQLAEDGRFDRFDQKRLSNFMRRRRKLGETLGEVRLQAATSPAEIDALHAAFLEQRAARFEQMGIENVFSAPRFLRFFRETAIDSLGAKEPTLLMHGLHAGDAIVATAFGSLVGGHYTQYINSTAGGEAAKFRLIGLLMQAVFADVAARGATTIDMGLGDFDYKTDWAVPTPVYDTVIPLTIRGRLAGTALLATRRAKRAIKQHDGLWALARKLRAGLRPGRPQAEQQD